MASTRAFKNLANLRSSFDEPFEEEARLDNRTPTATAALQAEPTGVPFEVKNRVPASFPSLEHGLHPVSPITGKVDRRRLRKVLKTPSVSLSVAVRTELHEQVGEMLFARKTTWIALLDQLLNEYVAKAKATGSYPK